MAEHEHRITKLENDSDSFKSKFDQMNEIQQKVSNTLSIMAVAQNNVSTTLEKVNNTLERFRDFEVVTAAERKNEREHRDRLDRRIDNIQIDIANSKSACNSDIDKLYQNLRDINEKLNTKIDAVDKVCINNFNILDKKFSVKSGIDTVKQAVSESGFKLRGDRLWKVLFWSLTFLALVAYKGLV